MPLLAVACAPRPGANGPALSADASGSGAAVESPAPASSSSFGSYLAGRFARSTRDLDSAADFLVQALADDPDNHDLRYQAFGALIGAGRVAESLPLAEGILAVDPSAPLPGLALALAAFRAGDPGTARERLAALNAGGYGVIMLPLVEGWITFSEGDLEAALAILDAMPDSAGVNAFRTFHEGLMNELAGNSGAAETAYRTAADAQPGAFRVAQALGGFHERQGRADDARAVYQAFAATNADTPWLDGAFERLDAGGPPPPPLVADPFEGVAEALFGLANALEGEEEHDEALALVRLADDLRPDHDAIALLLGEIFEAQDRSAEAVAAYDRIAHTSPLSWTARLRVAVNRDALGRSDEAIADLEAMAAERPERSDSWLTIGDIRRANEQWGEAVVAYDRAVDLIGTPEARHWRLYYVRGIALERSKQWPRAEADFLEALELEPDQPYVLNYLGYSWVDQGINLDRALDMIESAVDQRPNDGFIVDSLGWAYYRLGDYPEAVRHLERAVELEPDDATINDHLGDAFWRVGRYAEASFQWRRALSLAPDDELAAAIRTKLEHGLVTAPATSGDG
ncbi:MAG: tetratricopeptide repeat protein [Alphaproteobacteria bacterium]